jgi:hypothetical protein
MIRSFAVLSSASMGLHCLDNLCRIYTHTHHALEKIDYLLFVIRETITVELLPDSLVLRRPFLVLIENPFQCRAVAQSVGPRILGHAY